MTPSVARSLSDRSASVFCRHILRYPLLTAAHPLQLAYICDLCHPPCAKSQRITTFSAHADCTDCRCHWCFCFRTLHSEAIFTVWSSVWYTADITIIITPREMYCGHARLLARLQTWRAIIFSRVCLWVCVSVCLWWALQPFNVNRFSRNLVTRTLLWSSLAATIMVQIGRRGTARRLFENFKKILKNHRIRLSKFWSTFFASVSCVL